MGKWEMVRLGDVCNLNMGQSPESSSYNETGEGLPFYQGNADFGELYPIIRYHCSAPKKIALPNDILLSVRAPIGALNIANEKCCIGRGLAALTPVKNLEMKYLYYILKDNHAELNAKGTGSTFKAINKSNLSDFEIPLPPLKIQQNIAATLDTAAALLKLRQQQLAELEALIQSVFYEMFGDLALNKMKWEKRVLVEFCKNESDIRCGPFGTQLSKDEYKTEGVALWGIPQINTKFKIKPTDFLSEKKAIQLAAYSIIAGDIVMSRKGNVGKCAIYPDNFSSGIMHSDALRIRVDNKKISSIFLMHQLHHSRYVLNQIESVSSGAVMAGVNVTKLKKIFIHNPPIEIQNKFAAIVQKIDQQKALVQQSIDETQTLFDSLMSQYFD